MTKHGEPVIMNSMFQVESEDEYIPDSVSATDAGGAKFVWLFSQGILCLFCLDAGIVGPFFLIIIALSYSTRNWVRSQKNPQKMSRYYLISALIFFVLIFLLFGLTL